MTAPRSEYDIIIVGGGINGLATGAYLQKAGLSVAIFERRDESGTFCATEEVLHPGVKLNLHASQLLPHLGPPFVDLELERFGLELLKPPGSNYGYFYPFLDGNAVLFSRRDARETYEMFKRISPKDAETYRKIVNFYGPMLPEIMHASHYTKSTDEGFLASMAMNASHPIFPRDWMWMTAFEFLDCLFENEQIRTAVLSHTAFGGVEALSSRLVGPMSVVAILTQFTVENGMTARGGSHGLTHSLVRCFVHHGGKIFYNCPVTRILIEKNQAKGVVLTTNSTYPDAEFRASRAVISNLSAPPTFLDLVGEEYLTPATRVALKKFDYRGASLFANYYVLSEPPNFACSEKFPEVNNTFIFNFGAETMADASRLVDSVLVRDTPPDLPVAWGACFNYCIADPTQAPPGQYTVQTWADVPYDIRPLGGPEKWDDIRESYADKVEEVFARYLPNLKSAKIARYVNTPHDYVRRNPHCGGNMHPSGSVHEWQMGAGKPFPGCGAPRTPIDSLYISQSFGAGNYTYLGAAYIAACQVFDDLGGPRPDWWRAKAMDGAQELWRREGFTQRFTVD